MNEAASSRWWQYGLRLLHLVGLGLWFGTLVFFPFCVALPVIDGMKTFATRPDNWLHLQSEREGIRLAGEFLDIVFQRYFLFQVGCGLAALLPALAWWRRPGKAHRIRVVLLVVALALVAVNEWGLSPRVQYWRHLRYATQPSATSTVPLTQKSHADSDGSETSRADDAFQFWHNLSLAADLVTLALVSGAMLLAPLLPQPNCTATQEDT